MLAFTSFTMLDVAFQSIVWRYEEGMNMYKQGINNHVIYLIEFAEMGTFRCVYFLFPWEIHHFGLGNRHGPKLIPRVADRLEQ